LAEGPVRDRDLSAEELLDNGTFPPGENIESHTVTIVGKALNKLRSHSCKRQVCESLTRGSKNLNTTAETKTAAGEKENTQLNAKGKIIEFGFHMQKEGLAKATIETFTYLLIKLQNNGANLLEPESVKEVLSKLKASNNTKATIKGAYSCFLKFLGLSWKAPKIQFQTKIPFIPSEQEIDALIAGCGHSTSAILQTLKETGMRIGEALRLKWTAINAENNTIILNEPEKNSNPRIFKVSTKLIGTLQGLPKKDERIFGSTRVQHKINNLQQQRDKLALKLGNPRLKQITFHTLRHWRGTMEYHKTHDPWHVKQLLGHKSLKSTELYINVEQAIFSETDQQFHVKVVSSVEEATKLLEVGFEYVMDIDGKKLLRKRK
jgi:integrase